MNIPFTYHTQNLWIEELGRRYFAQRACQSAALRPGKWTNTWRIKTALTGKLKFRTNRRAGISTNSRRNPCGRPPSNPSTHSTCSESADWFDTEQFCSWNGRPANVRWISENNETESRESRRTLHGEFPYIWRVRCACIRFVQNSIFIYFYHTADALCPPLFACLPKRRSSLPARPGICNAVTFFKFVMNLRELRILAGAGWRCTGDMMHFVSC